MHPGSRRDFEAKTQTELGLISVNKSKINPALHFVVYLLYNNKIVELAMGPIPRGNLRSVLKGVSAGRRELPGDLVWYTQDKGLKSYEELKSRVSNWGLQVKTYRLIYATDETCEKNETRGSCLKGKYPKMVWTDLERSRQVQGGPEWSRRVWKVCGLGGQILTPPHDLTSLQN